jgi:hypothetical protein
MTREQVLAEKLVFVLNNEGICYWWTEGECDHHDRGSSWADGSGDCDAGHGVMENGTDCACYESDTNNREDDDNGGL